MNFVSCRLAERDVIASISIARPRFYPVFPGHKMFLEWRVDYPLKETLSGGFRWTLGEIGGERRINSATERTNAS